ncbi:hypothetical protein SEA_DIRTMONSTER_21 [Mycobacterium phage DirtMonster]|uniref:Uncharacterized protein n=1 Tax=Mycobacterium phage Nappy TaxID=1088866 RepID=G8IDL7_9CAUD|nr:hypothetical protein NAPPY_25 [Mycobacterium phage Nappy]AER25855.1 hypothetical protein NAPPY_25 [Mycobacterium phage Nappy]QAY14293.1 hypothetical protein SEA_DARKO_22 [Mycobacterium phage Darko]QED11217.1 hypothetical protein SEA_LOLAVINCA_26 [Mycobacterium phage LolaVinca]QWY80621.1 hypothetical protein SEA_BANANAFENCE_25 [Mycobacterium phage BananaFence]
MAAQVIFECRDKLIVEYCVRKYGSDFQHQLDKHHGPLLHLLNTWRAQMEREAALQQWYDYTEDDRGRRTPIRNAEGEPVMLVPTIHIDAGP